MTREEKAESGDPREVVEELGVVHLAVTGLVTNLAHIVVTSQSGVAS